MAPVLQHEVCAAVRMLCRAAQSLQKHSRLVTKELAVVDCTFGTGGHAEAILDHSPEFVRVIGIDCDGKVIPHAERLRERFGQRFAFVRGRYTRLTELLPFVQFGECVDPKRQDVLSASPKATNHPPIICALFETGPNADQLTDPSRGFMWNENGPLDMRYDQEFQYVTAGEIIARSPYRELHQIFEDYHRDFWNHRVTEGIVSMRKVLPFESTLQLAEVMKLSVAVTPSGIHSRPGVLRRNKKVKRRTNPCRRAFGALGMAVNRSVTEIREGLDQCWDVLQEGGAALVLSHHSLENEAVIRFGCERRDAFCIGKTLGMDYYLIRTGAPGATVRMRMVMKQPPLLLLRDVDSSQSLVSTKNDVETIQSPLGFSGHSLALS